MSKAEDGRSTEELLDALRGLVVRLRSNTVQRITNGQRPRHRDETLQMVTDGFLLFNTLASRLAGLSYAETAVHVAEDEVPERASEASLADLFSAPDLATTDRIEYLRRGMCECCAEKAAELRGELHDLQLRDFRVAFDLMVRGARDPEEVTKRVLAVTRRVMPEMLQEHFGLSQADVSRRLGETRATTSAREKRVIEAPLKKAGARGFKLAGGARGEEHRKRCAQAQKGNTNRADGELRKRSRA